MPLPGLSALPVPYVFAAGGLGLLLVPWFIRWPALALAALLLSLLTGQLIRLPLSGQGGGVLASDLAVVIILVAAFIKLGTSRSPRLPITSYELLVTSPRLSVTSPQLLVPLFIPFLLWSLFSLAVNAPALGAPNAAIAAAYWLRLATHLLLLPALIVLLSDAACAAVVRRGLLIATTALAVLGLLQILILPNMSDLAGLAPRSPARPAGVLGEGGWDPHAGRLVSTWLDPNFMGAFFAMMLPYLLSCLRPSRALSDARQNRWVLFALGLSGAALILTQSRSAFVSLALALLLLSPLFVSRLMRSAASPRRSGQRLAYASAALLIVGSLALGGFFMRERLAGLLRVDDTVALRAAALSAVWPLAHQHAWLGVGYNAYQFAAARAGIISDFTIHSRAGADNSLLTLWVTVGLPGLLFFLLPFCAIAQMLLRAVVYSPRASAACGALAALTVLFIDSQFINSLLYAHLLITLALIVALALIAPAR